MKSVVLEGRIERIKAVDGGQFDARFIMSASTPDRVKDTIDPKAYAAVVRKSSKIIALFNHDPDHPIGYWAKLEAAADTLKGHIKLASTNLGAMIKALLDDDVPLGASISLRGKGAPNDIGGIHFTEIDVIECSIVSTPAHPRAVRIMKKFGFPLQSSEGGTNPATMSSRKAETLRLAKKAIARSKSILPKTVKNHDTFGTDQKSKGRPRSIG